MRIILLAALLSLFHSGITQDILEKTISVNFKNQTIEKCLVKLERVSGVNFSYNSKQIHSIDKTVNTSFTNESLGKVLDNIFIGTNFKYKVIGNQITIYELKSEDNVVILSGYMRDAESLEEITGAKIYFPDLQKGCTSNSYGYYAIELPKGTTRLIVSSFGMKKISDTINIQQNMVINFELELSDVHLNTIEVIRDSIEAIPDPTELTTLDYTKITPGGISRIPSISGETDLIKYIQQFPGIQPSNDGGANYQVRGSGSGNNLILIDEIPIYHPTHMLGIYSIVNVDAITSASLYKDYIPLRFGTRNSSVLQIHTKEGNLDKMHFTGDLSLISLRLNLEGPIIRNKASYYISGRQSLFPRVASELLNSQKFTFPSYHDFNAKINFHLNSNNRIYFTGYYGQDKLDDTTSSYNWGNLAGAFRWNHIYNAKTFSNLSITHSEFNYSYTTGKFPTYSDFGQKVITDQLRYDFTNFFRDDIRIEYGLGLSWIRTRKGNSNDVSSNVFLERNAFENGIYASIDKKFSPRFSIKGGVRIPVSFHLGTQDTTTYLNSDLSTTTVVYHKNKLYDLMFFADPRFLITYNLTDKDRLQGVINITSQHTHIINYINYFLPIEIWTTSNAFLKPERNYAQSIGWTHREKYFESSVTIFNRYIKNVIDYATPIYTSSQDIESNLLTGNLHAYGFEFQLNVNVLPLYSASLSYTYTKTKQFIEGINNNEPYVAANDRPHFWSFSQYFNLTKKWQVSTNYIFHTGTAVTLPNGQFIIGETAFPLYSSKRNAERLPYYSRFDVSFTRKLGVKKRKNRYTLVFTLTNLFNRYNPSVVYVDQLFFESNTLDLKSTDYAPFMLNIKLNFKF